MKNTQINSKFITGVFKMVIDYDVPIEEYIKFYDRVNCNITVKNFPPLPRYKREDEFALFCFDKDMVSEGVMAEMGKANYQPAIIWELLMFGKNNPEPHMQFRVLSLGSVAMICQHNRVGYLDGRGSKLIANLVYSNSLWKPKYRFLGIRKATGLFLKK